MRRIILLLLLLLSAATLRAQYSLTGIVQDTTTSPIPYTTVSLLDPADSTLAFFGITNTTGFFEIKGIESGNYLLQAAFLGFKTLYRQVSVPAQGNTIGNIVLRSASNLLDEIEVTGERVPIRIKGDSIEYNADAFRTRPDANVEELLKKLPGVQVDRAGNIKAQGEDVGKILVDGKEFFGDDPKVATKNLPADAIKKVQVFNKRSDATEFTGIDDGSREKTINLQLKDGKKVGYFGEVQAGAGTDGRYKGGGKIYKFRPQSQFAALGMYNNINQSGFSFQDYLSLNGGIRSLMNGNGNIQFQLNGRNSIPVDFGQPVTGLITSGAGGVNYSYEPKKNNRISVSYLGNGADKKLNEQVDAVYSIPDGLLRKDDTKQNTLDIVHRVNMNIRKDIDSSHQFTLYSNAAVSTSSLQANSLSTSAVRDAVLNRLDSRLNDNANGLSVNARASYLKQMDGSWPVFKLTAEGSYSKDLKKSQWENLVSFLDSGAAVFTSQFRNDAKEAQRYSTGVAVVRNLGKGYYLEPGINAGFDRQATNRKQGTPPGESVFIDSLSPDFKRTYTWIRPGLSLKKSFGKKQLNIELNTEASTLLPELASGINTLDRATYFFLLPSLEWQNEYGNGKRLNLTYTAMVNAPTAEQMLPVVDNTNPVQQYIGNSSLRPEYSHSGRVGWLCFDQFSFTSLFVNLNGRYTADKISWSRNINAGLAQVITPVNTDHNYDLAANVEFSRPLKRLGINANISLTENFERGISPINDIDNRTTNLSHEGRISFSNRKNEKWSIECGASASMSDIRYSVNSALNNSFNSFTGFSAISYRPTDHWYFMVSADISHYNAQSFSNSVVVPLLKSEVSYFFMKGNRGIFTLDAFDLLNRNTGIQRSGELGFVRETRSNVIGRYIMLSFKYRLNKAGKNKDDLDIQIRRK